MSADPYVHYRIGADENTIASEASLLGNAKTLEALIAEVIAPRSG